jgi:hypothetical protein
MKSTSSNRLEHIGFKTALLYLLFELIVIRIPNYYISELFHFIVYIPLQQIEIWFNWNCMRFLVVMRIFEGFT